MCYKKIQHIAYNTDIQQNTESHRSCYDQNDSPIRSTSSKELFGNELLFFDLLI